MSKPMLTSEAVSKHQCIMCAHGEYCGYECVEDSTCSVRCKNCTARVWFSGNWADMPKFFICPKCGKEQFKKDH